MDVVDSDGHAETYHLVGAVESDPSAGRISVDSPVGRALVGKKKGDRITVSVPSGTLTLSIKAVKKAHGPRPESGSDRRPHDGRSLFSAGGTIRRPTVSPLQEDRHVLVHR